jgi:putative addiction module component (TIGR02574 family)
MRASARNFVTWSLPTLLRSPLESVLEEGHALWYSSHMPHDLKELTEEALRLPPEERVVLAESLLLTIDEKHDQSVDEATMAELERRLADFREGKVVGIPAEEAFRRIRETLKRRS